jgi:hypothetical protein
LHRRLRLPATVIGKLIQLYRKKQQMKKCVLLLLLSLTSIDSGAQNKITVESVKLLFQKSKDKLQNGNFIYPTNNTWEFENSKDSLYFKQDTLTGIFYKSGKHKSLCEAVTWTFHKDNEFVIHRESLCKEPPTISALKFPDDYFSIAVYKVKNEIMIDVLRRNDKMIMESFKIITIIETKEYCKIILRRRFKPYG